MADGDLLYIHCCILVRLLLLVTRLTLWNTIGMQTPAVLNHSRSMLAATPLPAAKLVLPMTNTHVLTQLEILVDNTYFRKKVLGNRDVQHQISLAAIDEMHAVDQRSSSFRKASVGMTE